MTKPTDQEKHTADDIVSSVAKEYGDETWIGRGYNAGEALRAKIAAALAANRPPPRSFPDDPLLRRVAERLLTHLGRAGMMDTNDWSPIANHARELRTLLSVLPVPPPSGPGRTTDPVPGTGGTGPGTTP